MMPIRRLLGVLLVAAAGAALAEEAPPRVPEWFLEHVAFMTQGSGRFVTDNSAYKSAEEPLDAYATEWKAGIGGMSLTGRLFGIRDGRETADFWEFREYWHPGERRVVVLQFGRDGRVGAGTIESTGEGRSRTVQTFLLPDGTSSQVLHDAEEVEGGEQRTWSYEGRGDGSWKKNRYYVWKLAP